jgi:regulatory protein
VRRDRSSGSPPDSTDNVRFVAVRLLGRRDLTRAELTRRLIDRGYAETEVEAAVDRLVAGGSLDDKRTALAHVRTASRVKGRGRIRIQRELTARGIARDIVDEALQELQPDDDVQGIRRFLLKRRVSSRMSAQERQKLFQQLLRRGFPSDAIARALNVRNLEEE